MLGKTELEELIRDLDFADLSLPQYAECVPVSKFSKVHHEVSLYRKCTRALTFNKKNPTVETACVCDLGARFLLTLSGSLLTMSRSLLNKTGACGLALGVETRGDGSLSDARHTFAESQYT